MMRFVKVHRGFDAIVLATDAFSHKFVCKRKNRSTSLALDNRIGQQWLVVKLVYCRKHIIYCVWLIKKWNVSGGVTMCGGDVARRGRFLCIFLCVVFWAVSKLSKVGTWRLMRCFLMVLLFSANFNLKKFRRMDDFCVLILLYNFFLTIFFSAFYCHAYIFIICGKLAKIMFFFTAAFYACARAQTFSN